MALSYTFTKYKDAYTLTNNGLTTITYTVYNLTCDSSKQTATGTISPSSTKEISFLYDGKYQILLDDGTEQELIENINVYYDLLTSFIDNVESLVCGCKKCDDCGDVCNDCESFLAGLTKALSFNSLNSSLYQAYVNTIAESVRCDLNDTVVCAMLKEKVYGNTELEEIIKRIIGYYYFAFYFKDSAMAVDQDERDYVAIKYKYIKIAKCMKKIGLSPSEVIEVFESNTLVYFWQIDNSEDITIGIDEVSAGLNAITLLTQPSVAFEEFEEGHIVTYTLIGKRVFAIAPTQVQNFLIEDSLGNDITDAFDIEYRVDLNLALFVSKIPYSFSNTFFKFKKII